VRSGLYSHDGIERITVRGIGDEPALQREDPWRNALLA
jgi:hypothetical protein